MKTVLWLLLSPLAVLGCPCCGPRWYARLMVWAYKVTGEQLPSELEGWRRHRQHNWQPWPGRPGWQFCPDCPACQETP
jgi:hypothetical protein